MKKHTSSKLTASAIVAGCLAASTAGLSGCSLESLQNSSFSELVESAIETIESLNFNENVYGQPDNEEILSYIVDNNNIEGVYGPPDNEEILSYIVDNNNIECVYGPPEYFETEPVQQNPSSASTTDAVEAFDPDLNVEEDVYGPPGGDW